MMSMTNQFMSKVLLLLATMMLAFASLTVAAEDMSVPQALVKNASDDMLKALKDHEAELEANPDKIYSLVEAILMPHFDFEKMSKLALGKNWRQASASRLSSPAIDWLTADWARLSD